MFRVQVEAKPGAGAQVGMTELVQSKADGYTIGATNLPTVLGIYLDPQRQAVFSREDLVQVALQVDDPAVVAVAADSPYQTMKDLLDAAKANPEGVKASSTGILSHDHLNVLLWEEMASVKFAVVQFDGAAPALTALLGEHVEAFIGNVGSVYPMVQDSKVRVLGIMDKQENEFLPGVKTMEAQGYDLYLSSSRGYSVPGGTPAEEVDILAEAMKKAMESPEHQEKMKAMGLTMRYMGPEEFTVFWDEREAQVKPLIAKVRQ